ncbi:glycosyltransferase [Clostridium sp. CX1]|uniref:Hyaluronan synthase n=1 Tax=Clostridium tanneri TaxID=3037988 RepID=A0ABU4JQT2_9CLOT|nr:MULTISPECIES: glycosyltransferase [unclassified Clostridium]MCT8978704.1 glycosyltransferase [Clostridium sp. CX1]MDW8800484.1 glycosyltransferase [Clostridium sp. A1-XYC3]
MSLKQKIVKKQKDEEQDILLKPRKDRRLLSEVPDKEGIRTTIDRRGKKVLEDYEDDPNFFIKSKKAGIRYVMQTEVKVVCRSGKVRSSFTVRSLDVSTTGILLELKDEEQLNIISKADSVKLKFEVLPGAMPEGYEMKVNISSKKVRNSVTPEGKILCGMEFIESLSQYSNRKKDRYILVGSSLLLLFISAFIILMRAESIIYFKFNKWMYLYSIIAAVFLLSRYLFGVLYKPLPMDVNYTPGVTIIIPCFNEEEWIENTILSCINQDYPVDKLEVIVVDDRSNDNSVEQIKKTIDRLNKEAERFDTQNRVKYFVQEENLGKRDALCRGVLEAKHDLVVFVDSDSFLDPFAIRNLVQPFKDPKMGGVSGRTDVANTYTNALTKMQSVRYYIAFRIMKAAEAYFDAVTCLSGPLSCYRKQIVIDNMEEWLNQRFLRQKATFGDDRAMTNFVLKGYRTSYQDTAICATIVPNKYKVFLKQQMRWKRSWLRESIIAGKFMWKKEPFMAAFFYMGVFVPIAAPVIVTYNLLYVPIVHRIFPTTFLVGLLMMALMMSFAQMFFRRSTTWIFGMFFCIYYEAILLWQMPIAWVTFWKSTWGTRMTPSDIEAERKKQQRRISNILGKKGENAYEN